MKILSFLVLFIAVSASKADLAEDILESIFKILMQLPFPAWPSTSVADEEVSFYLVDRSHPDPVLLNDDNLNLIQPNKYTVYIVHGYLNSHTEPWMIDMTNEYMRFEDMQVIQTDWRDRSYRIYPESAQNTRGVGKIIARHIVKAKLNIANVHLVGHSLGAHTCGFAAKEIQKLTGQKIPRISGLDPAGPAFFGAVSTERLDKTDATIVDVTHSDGGVFGHLTKIGTHDFFTNGGIPLQPSCPVVIINKPSDIVTVGISLVICSHMRSIDYFTYSINHPVYKYTKCSNYASFLAGLCSLNKKVVYGEQMPLNTEQGEYHVLHLTWPAI